MRVVAIVLAWITSVMTLLLVAGHGPWAGRVLVSFTPNRGLNVGDVLVLGLWGLAMYCCAWLWRRGEP